MLSETVVTNGAVAVASLIDLLFLDSRMPVNKIWEIATTVTVQSKVQ
jgi:hypothetical protein